MEDNKKAKILDYMKKHAETLLNGEVKDIGLYSPEQIILAKYDAQQFMKCFKEAEKKVL